MSRILSIFLNRGQTGASSKTKCSLVCENGVAPDWLLVGVSQSIVLLSRAATFMVAVRIV